MLHDVSDSTIVWCATWYLVGWVCGIAFTLSLFWRPITRSRHEGEAMRLLRLQLEDSDKQLTAAIQANDRLARMLVLQARCETTRVGGVSGRGAA